MSYDLPLADWILAWLCAFPLFAQTGKVEARGTAGWTTFVDESPRRHLLIGGSLRFYVTPRLSLEPEFLYLYRSAFDKDVLIAPNLAWDFARRGRVTPYVIGGAGWLHGIRPRFSENEWAFSGGLGAKIHLAERMFVSPRLGFEPIARLSVSLGWVLSP